MSETSPLQGQAQALLHLYYDLNRLFSVAAEMKAPMDLREVRALVSTCTTDNTQPNPSDQAVSRLTRVFEGLKCAALPLVQAKMAYREAADQLRIELKEKLARSGPPKLVELFDRSLFMAIDDPDYPGIRFQIKALPEDQRAIVDAAFLEFRTFMDRQDPSNWGGSNYFPKTALLSGDLDSLKGRILKACGNKKAVSTMTDEQAQKFESLLAQVKPSRWKLIVPVFLVGIGTYLASHLLPSPTDTAMVGAAGVGVSSGA